MLVFCISDFSEASVAAAVRCDTEYDARAHGQHVHVEHDDAGRRRAEYTWAEHVRARERDDSRGRRDRAPPAPAAAAQHRPPLPHPHRGHFLHRLLPQDLQKQQVPRTKRTLASQPINSLQAYAAKNVQDLSLLFYYFSFLFFIIFFSVFEYFIEFLFYYFIRSFHFVLFFLICLYFIHLFHFIFIIFKIHLFNLSCKYYFFQCLLSLFLLYHGQRVIFLTFLTHFFWK